MLRSSDFSSVENQSDRIKTNWPIPVTANLQLGDRKPGNSSSKIASWMNTRENPKIAEILPKIN